MVLLGQGCRDPVSGVTFADRPAGCNPVPKGRGHTVGPRLLEPRNGPILWTLFLDRQEDCEQGICISAGCTNVENGGNCCCIAVPGKVMGSTEAAVIPCGLWRPREINEHPDQWSSAVCARAVDLVCSLSENWVKA